MDRFNVSPKELTLRLTNILVSAVTIILGLRFFLRLFGADETNTFVSWIYDTSGSLLAPFRGIFPTEVVDQQYVLEFNTLFAIVVYLVFGMFVMMVVDWLVPGRSRR